MLFRFASFFSGRSNTSTVYDIDRYELKLKIRESYEAENYENP